MVRHKSVGLHREDLFLRLREEVLLRLAEMDRGNPCLDELDDLRRGADLLRLHGLLYKVGREAGLELREARILGRDREELLDELQRLVEAACLREGLHGPFEHCEAVDRSGIERHAGQMAAGPYALFPFSTAASRARRVRPTRRSSPRGSSPFGSRDRGGSS